MMRRQTIRQINSKASIDSIKSGYVGPPNFVGGRNVDWAQDMASSRKEGGVRPDQCIILENFDIDQQGILVSRGGNKIVNTTALNSGARIHSMYRYRHTGGSASYFIVQAGTNVYTLNLTTGAATAIAAGVGATPLKWVTWNDKAYGFNGTGIFKYCPTDATPWQQVQDIDADAPDAADGVVFEDVLFTARDGTSYPSRVNYSDEFDPEAWQATNYRRIREGDGQSIMTLARLGSRLLCNKDKSAWWLYGSSIYSFAEELISEEVGQVGRLAFAAHEDNAFFQSNRGVEYFNPNTGKVFNNIARGTCAKEILALSRTVREAAVMKYWPVKNRLFLSFPDASTPVVYVWFLDFPNQDEDGNIWFPHTVYTGLTVSAIEVNNVTGDGGTMYWGSASGYVYQYDYGNTDNTVAIAGKMRWGFTDCGIPVRVKSFPRAIVPARVTGTLTVTLNVDFSTKTQDAVTDTYLPTTTGVWDVGLWDAATWAGSWVATRKARFTKMKGVKVSLQINNNYEDKIEIHPFKIEYIPLEYVRLI